jgi:hypothetical protein
MAITINDAMADSQMDCLGTLLDGGFIDLYDGTLPANSEDPPDGTLLVSCQLLSPAYSTASGNAAAGIAVITGTAVATGVAQYAQQRDAANTAWMYGTVTAVSGGGDMEIDNGLSSTAITSGQIVVITASILTQLEACP